MPSLETDHAALCVASPIELPIAVLGVSAFGPFTVLHCPDHDAIDMRLVEGRCDALVLPDGAEAVEIAVGAGREVAILVVVPSLEPEVVLAWLRRGVQDVMLVGDLLAPSLPQRLRGAIERKRLEREARTAYATDLETGLPHQQQLIEHISQLLALRAREPAPMAVLALRIEGLATIEARFGREASNVLRRKIAVRLRAGVRASDVVASLGDDGFAVLLGSVLAPADAERVGAKLLGSVTEPLRIGAEHVTIAAALGVGQYPEDGSQPDALLRRAIGLAASSQAQGRAGFSNFVEAHAAPPAAANDE